MSNTPQSFVMMLRRRYRVYFNPQGGGWYVAYHDGTKRQRRSLGAGTRPEAEAAVKTLDQPPAVNEQAKHRATWSEVQSGFLQTKAALDRARGTLSQYTLSLDAFGRYLRTRGVQYIDEVSLSILEGFKLFRINHDQCDAVTAYHNSIVIKGAFKWASTRSRGYLTFNPAVDWETPTPIKPRRPTYTAEEIELLERGVKAGLRPIVTVLAWSGMRISELVNLRWQDVDFDQRVIHIRIQDEWKPKGKRDRVVPMHPKVEAVLRSLPKGKLVFHREDDQPFTRGQLLRRLQTDQKRLGVKQNDIHAFRRFFATTMIRNGVDAETVRQWGGWKSFNTMLRYLADVNANDSVKAMDAMIKRCEQQSEADDKKMTKRSA